MSDKKILKESTIRQMMKLANIPSLSDKFIQENYYSYNEQEEVEVEDEVVLDAPEEELEVDAEVAVDEPSSDLPAAEELVQDLMSVISDHFPEVEVNVDTEGGEEVDAELDVEEPPVDLDDEEVDAEVELDAEVEEEPVLETDLEEVSLGTGIADAAGEESETAADMAMMPEDAEIEVVEEDPRSDLIDAIAAKVAERILAEAKKTNK